MDEQQAILGLKNGDAVRDDETSGSLASCKAPCINHYRSTDLEKYLQFARPSLDAVLCPGDELRQGDVVGP